jgi:protocatechuate 3,4-dioxygenase beta subunit
MLSALVTGVAALILLTQNPVPQSSKLAEKQPPPCTVSGRVVTAADGTPLKSSRLALIPEHRTRESQVYAAASDSSGRFIIKDVPAGRYQFLATHTGYVDQYYQSRGADSGAILALQAGQEVKDILFRMTLAAVITGRVNDEDGEPIAFVQVVALRRPTEEELEDLKVVSSRSQETLPAGMAQTDDRGQYRIFGLRAGEYYIKAVDQYEPMFQMFQMGHESVVREALGSQYAPVYYPGVTQIGQAETVLLSSGQEAQAEFAMRRIRTVDISGRVISVDGKPADVYVSLEEFPTADYGVEHSTTADAKGEFKIKSVAPGSYLLHAQQHSFGADTNYHATQKIEVGADNIDSIMLALGRGVSFSGRVRISGTGTIRFEQMLLQLFSQDDQSERAWTRVKKDGTFQFIDVPDGTFAFRIYGLEENWYLKSVRLGADDLLAKGLDVEKGESSGRIQVVVSNNGAELGGSVTQDEKPVIGARIRLTPDPETRFNRFRSHTAFTDQSGRFSIVGLAPGQYRVIAKASAPDRENANSSDSESVSLSEHDHKTVELTVAPPQTP